MKMPTESGEGHFNLHSSAVRRMVFSINERYGRRSLRKGEVGKVVNDGGISLKYVQSKLVC